MIRYYKSFDNDWSGVCSLRRASGPHRHDALRGAGTQLCKILQTNFRERRYSVVRVVLNFNATSKTLHIYPSMLQGVWTGPQPRPTTAYFQAHRTVAMHDPAYELPR